MKKKSGFTLFEVLVSIVFIGIIMVGLQQVLGSALSSYENTKDKQDLLVTARFAVDRMARFAEESDAIVNPVSDTAEETLKVSERLLDNYNNSTRAYDIDGDGLIDADNDANDLVNDDTTNDPAEYVTFSLDKTDPNNWKLQESLPDYSTANLTDTTAAKVICENVVAFESKLLDTDLIEIRLALEKENRAVDLKTRVKARFVLP